jgi:hypothetical protein
LAGSEPNRRMTDAAHNQHSETCRPALYRASGRLKAGRSGPAERGALKLEAIADEMTEEDDVIGGDYDEE